MKLNEWCKRRANYPVFWKSKECLFVKACKIWHLLKCQNKLIVFEGPVIYKMLCLAAQRVKRKQKCTTRHGIHMMSSHTSVASLLCLEWSVSNVVRLGGNLTFSKDGVMVDHGAKNLSLIFSHRGAGGRWNGTHSRTEDGQLEVPFVEVSVRQQKVCMPTSARRRRSSISGSLIDF